MKHPFDVHVGWRLCHCRCLAGMAQQQLGVKLGIKAQQIQDHETGANRISASLMQNIAAAMEVPVSFFFEGLARALNDANCPARRQEVPKISPPAEALSSNNLSLPKIFPHRSVVVVHARSFMGEWGL